MGKRTGRVMDRRIVTDRGAKIYYIVGVIFVTIVTLLCLLPFIMLLSGSLSDNKLILSEGYSIIPKGFTLYAYETIFENPKTIISAYGVSLSVTAIGTLLSVLLTAMTGYVLSRPDFRYANRYAFFLYFTTLFNGGTIPWYIITKNVFHLSNSIWALILPAMLGAFNIFLFRNFLKAIPHALVESARIDGANEYRIFWQIMIPLAKPAVATIALFVGLAYWNDWFRASLLIDDSSRYPLQYVLVRLMNSAKAVVEDTSMVRDNPIPGETIKLAMAIITTGPVLLFYPFAQKHFVSGLTIGGVKG